LWIPAEPENRHRVFPDFYNAAFALPCFHALGGMRIRASAWKRKTDRTFPCWSRSTVIKAPLVTDEQRAALLVNGRLAAASEPNDPLPVVRLFTPDAHATWLLTALDPADEDTAYGLIDLGISMPELGRVKLSDLASIVGPRQQPVMRDRYFQAVRPLSEYVRLAQENGSIVD